MHFSSKFVEKLYQIVVQEKKNLLAYKHFSLCYNFCEEIKLKMFHTANTVKVSSDTVSWQTNNFG